MHSLMNTTKLLGDAAGFNSSSGCRVATFMRQLPRRGGAIAVAAGRYRRPFGSRDDGRTILVEVKRLPSSVVNGSDGVQPT